MRRLDLLEICVGLAAFLVVVWVVLNYRAQPDPPFFTGSNTVPFTVVGSGFVLDSCQEADPSSPDGYRDFKPGADGICHFSNAITRKLDHK